MEPIVDVLDGNGLSSMFVFTKFAPEAGNTKRETIKRLFNCYS